MFARLRSIISYLWDDGAGEDDAGEDLSLEEAYRILESAQDVIEEKPTLEVDNFEEYSSYHKTGTITAAENGFYTIDDLYKFKSHLQNLRVGMDVSFTVYTSGTEIKVSDVIVKDDWHDKPHIEKTSWSIRTVICQITKRNGRDFTVTPGDLTFDLNSLSSEFLPILGDWIELQAKVELDERVFDLFGKILEVEKIRPVRPHILKGCVKQWHNETRTGVIDRTVYFNGDALSLGYVPVVGDEVIAEVIESLQGRYNWRALKLIPEKVTEKQISLIDTDVHDFEIDKEGVFISSNIVITANKLGELNKFTIELCNKSKDVLTLLCLNLPSNNSQCKVISPSCLTNINIDPGKQVNFEILCKVKNMGTTRELALFSFVNFNIGRWITVNLNSNKSEYNKASTADRGSILLPKSHSRFKQNPDQWVKGQRVIIPPLFVSAKLPHYPVPHRLLNIIENHGKTRADLTRELLVFKPCITAPFTLQFYEDCFHTLLHLEEIAYINEVKNYSQDRALFIKSGEYLLLEIENLSEKRPSLMTGDRIIAKDSYNEDAEEFEGFIYQVGAKHLHLKFDKRFHDSYRGEDMSVMAVVGRTKYCRMHHAIGLSIRNLGNSFLFPTKVVNQKPQVSFTYEEYYDSIHTTHKKISNRDSENNSNSENNIEKTVWKRGSRQEKMLQALRKYQAAKANTVALSREGINKIDEQKETEDLINKNSSQNESEPSTSIIGKSQLLLDSPDDEKRPKYNGKVKFNKQKSLLTESQKTFKLEWYNKSLNYYQKEAVRNILLGVARPLPYFIFGPPGTGKTVTLVETILQLLRLIPHSRLLVATPSNSAADLIALRLIDSGVLKPGDLVRLVAYRRVAENRLPLKLIPYCATADIAKEGTGRTFSVSDKGLALGCNSAVIGRHRITVGTCTALGVLFTMGFSKGHFTHIIVDEAGQAMEPEVMIPLSLLDLLSGQVILAGDPLQLGPVLLSKSAAEYGLKETFLDRMLIRFPYVKDSEGFPKFGGYDPQLVTKLVYNYRSLPDVLTLSSNLFYDGQLIATISPIDSVEAHLLNSVKEILPQRKNLGPPSVVFHGVIGENYQTADCPSWFNPNEASQIFYYVNELYRLGLKSTDIGIISPYTKQVRQIQSLLNEAEFDLPKVGTVQEFQGQEFNVILLSTVRSSESFKAYDLKYQLGFLSNPRRLNVAISRAQALIIIVGNPRLLSVDPQWRSVIKYCVDNDAYCGCDLV